MVTTGVGNGEASMAQYEVLITQTRTKLKQEEICVDIWST